MSQKKDQHGADHRHREKKSRNPRRTLRGAVQVPRGKAGDRGDQGNRPGKMPARDQRHDTRNGPEAQRSTHDLGNGHNRHAGRSDSVASSNLRGKITEEQATRMLERIAREQYLDNPNAIFQEGDDIWAFGRYLIHPAGDGYQIFRGATLAAQTGSSRVAISWCVADKLNRFQITQEMLWADQEVLWRQAEIQGYRHTLNITQDSMKKFVVQDRLADAQIKLKYAQERLDKCLNLAKYWQQKGFNNETSRLGIKN